MVDIIRESLEESGVGFFWVLMVDSLWLYFVGIRESYKVVDRQDEKQ